VFDGAFSARDTVHEYGGAPYAVAGGVVYFCNYFDEQQLYRVAPGSVPQRITSQKNVRYADFSLDGARNRLIAVRENHNVNPVKNEIVSISLDGSATITILATGNDFYSSPRLSPDGQLLGWLTWNFPNMPWTSNELWISQLGTNGQPIKPEQVAGMVPESIFQPEWSPNGDLYFVSDRTDWWNLYRWVRGKVEPVAPRPAEFGQAQWFFGMCTYAFESAERIVCAFTERGSWHLASINTKTLEFVPIDSPYEEITYVRAAAGSAVFCAGSPKDELAVVRLDLATTSFSILQRSVPEQPQLKPYLTVPRPIEFPTSNGESAYAFYYSPHNLDFQPPMGELPPLIVKTHGGPTAATSSTLDLRIQYWTSRGFAVVDVNYGGSTGYGRKYRFRLEKSWGIVDLNDSVNAAEHLTTENLADPKRLAISGGSAGGYTTLCALTFRTVFRAGASYYGIGDLEMLAKDTHKFESHYMDWLIGQYPEQAKLYKERSPINFVGKLNVPVAFFQGEDDPIVPPNQSATMADALRQRGVPYSYLLFKGEQHGFRNGQNIKRSLDAELYFYSVELTHQGLKF
jgi:dipeptidyl aminopeptidase/acylaminoacyl peptidase